MVLNFNNWFLTLKPCLKKLHFKQGAFLLNAARMIYHSKEELLLPVPDRIY